MARVRVVRDHQNLYGEKPAKAVGDEYEVPDNLVPILASAGLAEEVVDEPEPKKAKKAK